ncbi:unnamed protein product [Rodentolepis nana]|uniref:Endo/exonuclease/phosphatase domain-containing protein n=1 Tax=Rodentolepis nana TaxID=102285 RepID=A0A0R3TA71_RODNA|nr:unnamed protein product [Rodentolepis nana]
MLNSNPLELIYNNEDLATYLHYNGTRTTPDLVLASSDISEHTRRKIIDDSDSGHKLVIASIPIGSKSMTRKMRNKTIPRGKTKYYRVFWSKPLEKMKRKWDALEQLEELKRKRDALHITLEKMKRKWDALRNTTEQTGDAVCLAKHLHRLEVYTQPTCPLCNLHEEMEKTHLIWRPALKTRTESQKYL